MADDKKKHGGEPAVEFRWDPLQLASDKTFSTTIRIFVSGWWPEGRPREVSVSHYERGQKPPDGYAVRIQKGRGTFPLIGLKPGHHYHVVIYIGDRTPVQDVIYVPELPEPKAPEQELLESEKIHLERTRIYFERKKLAAQEKKPTRDEKKTIALKAKTELVKVKKELEKAQEEPEPKKRLEILGIDSRTGVLDVFLCRLGKDGKPEPGEICAVDGRRLSWMMKPDEDLVVASFDFRDQPRKVTFFLPDDREVKAAVEVPAKPKEKKPSGPSLWKRIKEEYVQERKGGQDGR